MAKLSKEFYNKNAVDLSKDLLGKIFISNIKGERLSSRIVEVEAYLGLNDKASHAYGGKITNRNKVMYSEPGLLYVFMIYGMYNCLNIVAGDINIPEAVLIRAMEPIDGKDTMAIKRYNKNYDELSKKQKLGLSNGPGKLCMAMEIDRSLNSKSLFTDDLYIEEGGLIPNIVTSKRIGIGYAEEAKDFPLRFYIKDNEYVSIR